MNDRVRSCIISPEIVGPFRNGGIGTHCYYLAQFLSRELQHDVTFLYTGKIEVQTEAYWQEWFRRELNVNFLCVPAEASPVSAVDGLTCNDAGVARTVFDWLRRQTFDICFFQELLGHGFRCIQAKRLGLAFQNTLLTCMLHSSWEWICQAMQMFPAYGCSELQTKYLERYSSERCDFLISPSRYMLDWARQNGVRLPDRTAVLPYLFDSSIKAVGYRKPDNKIIFFGRLEMRKGLVLFLEALEELDRLGVVANRRVQVTLLGKPGHTPDGGAHATIHRFRTRLSNAIEIRTLTDLGHREAIEFLSTNNDALVVCPSLVDNSPFAVIESLQLGFNLIASKTGGIPELFADGTRQFEPDPHSLAAKIELGLAGRLPPLAKRYSVEASARSWQKFCEDILAARSNAKPSSGSPKQIPPQAGTLSGERENLSPVALQSPNAESHQVSKTVPRYRKGDGRGEGGPICSSFDTKIATFSTERVRVLLDGNQSADDLDRALECLAKQTHQTLDVTVLRDQSRNGAAASWEKMRSKFARPNWEFVEAGTTVERHSRIQALNLPSYTLLLSRGAYLYAEALAKLLAAATAANLDILSCAAAVILTGSKNSASPTHSFEPLGGCMEAGIFANVFGCGCVLVRSELLPQRTSELRQCLDQTMIWPFLASHGAAGRQCDSFPERLFTLRADELTFSQGDKNYQTHFDVLQACSHNLPDWVKRVLVESVAFNQTVARLHGRIAQLESEKKAANQHRIGTVLFKVNRERRRIKNQIEGFARRLAGRVDPRDGSSGSH